jgi:Domain of unknown function (DUF1876)
MTSDKETTMKTKRWTIEILLDNVEPGTARAVARLDTSEDDHLHGHGTWQGADEDVPGIGNDVAVSRALFEIADKLSVRASDLSRSAVIPC